MHDNRFGPQCCVDRNSNYICDRSENAVTGKRIEITNFGKAAGIVTIRNIGNGTISGGSLSVYVNGTALLCDWQPQSFDVGAASWCNLSAPCPPGSFVRVFSPDNSNTEAC